ncbi:MAG: hypothetical protein H0V12_10945, partial [Chloroflexi bacterium]|nr:hypothetical protein [Chloroflexota bacterium]
TWAAALWALWRGSTTLALAGLGAAAVALTAGLFNPLLLRYAVMVNAFLLIGYGYVAARSPPLAPPAGVGESVSPPMEDPGVAGAAAVPPAGPQAAVPPAGPQAE